MNNYKQIEDLLNQTIISVNGFEEGSDEIRITTKEGNTYRMYHDQDCCESVNINEIIGDVNDILDSPILRAEEKTNSEDTFGKINYPEIGVDIEFI